MTAWEQELRVRLHEIFLGEAAERLAAVDAALAALAGEGALDAEHQLGEALRHAHTIKGGARAAGRPDVERVAQGLESILERLRAGERAGPDLWRAILAAVDGMKALLAGRAADVDAVVAALENPAAMPPPAG